MPVIMSLQSLIDKLYEAAQKRKRSGDEQAPSGGDPALGETSRYPLGNSMKTFDFNQFFKTEWIGVR